MIHTTVNAIRNRLQIVAAIQAFSSMMSQSPSTAANVAADVDQLFY
jgi:hypothetical protein